MKKLLAALALGCIPFTSMAGDLILLGPEYSNPYVAIVSLNDTQHIVSTAPILATFNNSAQFLAYCVELTATASPIGQATPFTLVNYSNDNLSKLFTYHASLLPTKENTSALQLAVWEVLYDGFDNDVNTGKFKLLNTDTVVTSLTNTVLTEAKYVSTSYTLKLYEDESLGTKFQNFVSPVPEVSSFYLLGLGLLGVALRRGLK